MEARRSREIFSDATRTIAVVETVEIQQRRTTTGALCFVKVEPQAVVIRTADSTYALDMAGHPTTTP